MINSIFGFVVEGIQSSFFWFKAVYLNSGIDIVNFIVTCSIVLVVLALVTNSSSGLNRSLPDSEPSLRDRIQGRKIFNSNRPSVPGELPTGYQLPSGKTKK